MKFSTQTFYLACFVTTTDSNQPKLLALFFPVYLLFKLGIQYYTLSTIGDRASLPSRCNEEGSHWLSFCGDTEDYLSVIILRTMKADKVEEEKTNLYTQYLIPIKLCTTKCHDPASKEATESTHIIAIPRAKVYDGITVCRCRHGAIVVVQYASKSAANYDNRSETNLCKHV